MFICDKCGAQIPEGARFCPQCADVVTEADKVAKPAKRAQSQGISAEETEQIRLVCPKCESQFLYGTSVSGSRYDFSCPKCNVGFTSRIVKVSVTVVQSDAIRWKTASDCKIFI
jgi:protein-arginine kinase activator protein McsA